MNFYEKMKNLFLNKKIERIPVYPMRGNPNAISGADTSRFNLDSFDMGFNPGFDNAHSTYESPKKMRFTIPVGNISREEAEKNIRELMRDYWTGDINLPTREIKRIYSDIDPYGEENWDDV